MMIPADIPYASPIEEVRNTVPVTDDPTLPVLTFRTWGLGLLMCIITSFMSQISFYRRSQMFVSESCSQILMLVLGRLMASSLPAKTVGIPGTNWKFSLNPGPFTIKEHVLLVILTTTGFDATMGTGTISIMKVVFQRNVSRWASILMVTTSQMMGYGLAGLFRRILVNNPHMWYPLLLPKVSFYRALHEIEPRVRGRLSGLQIIVIFAVFCFAYTIVPNYFMMAITTLSFLCWIWKDSVTVHQLGAGYTGLGLGSIAIDWDWAANWVGNPLILPRFVVVNTIVGFVALLYVCLPVAYWMNMFDAKRFPIVDGGPYDYSGKEYDVFRVFGKDLEFNEQKYSEYSQLYMSISYALKLGFGFAALTATLVYFLLFHGRESWQHLRHSMKSEGKSSDIHEELMKKYKPIPQWWFFVIIGSMAVLGILNSQLFGEVYQFPTWAFLLSAAVPLILILPRGIILATTGTTIEIGDLCYLIIGYSYPGRPISTLTFPLFLQSIAAQATSFLAEFKLGHYMKIPPRSMLLAQIVGALLSTFVKLATMWWVLASVKNVCEPDKLPKSSMWTCPGIQQALTHTMIWGGVGPARMFRPGTYGNLYYFFLAGVAGPLAVWLAARAFPGRKWIRLINFPVLFSSAAYLLPVKAVHFWSFVTLTAAYYLVAWRVAKEWCARHAYDVSNGMDLGSSSFLVLQALSFGFTEKEGPKWWGRDFDEFCPLSGCPTAPGVVRENCPVS
ncbi:hypothetical protein BT93_K1428 [Corymbia citriodora subsp. variegata]|nr:hypothetical protein BT93_K1428 [Corymbia citriodora subsp. variegata]